MRRKLEEIVYKVDKWANDGFEINALETKEIDNRNRVIAEYNDFLNTAPPSFAALKQRVGLEKIEAHTRSTKEAAALQNLTDICRIEKSMHRFFSNESKHRNKIMQRQLAALAAIAKKKNNADSKLEGWEDVT
ncbi:MAG: hypothetical protein NTU49_08950, partial [Gammaproteobacteria bacterium]|nr:hypothetical protein [Gammaproteobacteria bacterium]